MTRLAPEQSRTQRPTPPRTIANFVNGQWRPSTSPRALDVLNPATTETLARVPLSTADEVDAAVRAAAGAFPSWREVPPQERVQPLYRLRMLLQEHAEEIARTITTEMGKTLDDARGEVVRAIQNVEVACGIPTLMMGYGLEDGAARGIDEQVIYQPLGVFAAVCPFNFPAMIPYWFWPYAVAAGNTFVVKPSERVPLTQEYLFRLAEQSGFPPGVLSLVNGARETVDALLAHPDVRGISFVGSTAVARHVYAQASANGKRVQAQGGAKNVLVVMPDALIGPSVDNMLGSCFGAAGQRCLAGSLVVTVGDAHGPLRDRLVERSSQMVIGNGLEDGVQLGPVTSAASRDRLVQAIEDALSDGAELLLDGRRPKVRGELPGYFVGPTIFDGVRPEMRLAQEELFGPVVGIIRVETLEDAIALVNSSRYGNAATIYTQSGAAARRFQYAATVGNVGINVGVAAPVAYFPFSGAKESFFGTLHAQGRDAVRFFTESKVVITRWL